MPNPLWDYVSTIYARDGVAPACLALQDRFGIDVNLLLYAAWLAHCRQSLLPGHLTALDVSVRDWREQVVRPLRALRRQLRGLDGAGDWYDAVKALELRAEREQLDRMYAFFRGAEALPAAHQPLRDNLALVARLACPVGEDLDRGISHLAALVQL